MRKSAGWREVSNRQAETGLKNSTFIVVATIDNQPVGMARIVGDGGYFSLIVDVVVLPRHNMNRFMNNLDLNAVPITNSWEQACINICKKCKH